jgi:riboflavin kinase/FMN adenylyltransferase
LAAVALTFRQHPLAVLAPAYAPGQLLRPERKHQLLRTLGMHQVLEVDFNEAFASLTPETFVRSVLHHHCGIRHLVCGSDFRFGKGGAGDVSLMRQLARQEGGFSLEIVDDIVIDGCTVRSTAVREAITMGDVRRAATFLTRPHEVTGHIVSGLARGRTIGFPTANLIIEGNPVIPLRGVYLTAVRLVSGTSAGTQVLPAMTNIGFNPTFGLERLSIETHILDFSGDIVGAQMEIFFLARLRDEQKFSGVEALRDQLHRDRSTSGELLASEEVRSLIARIPPPLPTA